MAVVKGTVVSGKPLKRLWDNYVIIGEVQKSSKIKFVVAAAVRDGVKYINIREFYFRQRDGVWRPAKDGITIPLLIPINDGTQWIEPYVELMQVLADAKDTLELMALSDPENAVYV